MFFDVLTSGVLSYHQQLASAVVDEWGQPTVDAENALAQSAANGTTRTQCVWIVAEDNVVGATVGGNGGVVIQERACSRESLPSSWLLGNPSMLSACSRLLSSSAMVRPWVLPAWEKNQRPTLAARG